MCVLEIRTCQRVIFAQEFEFALWEKKTVKAVPATRNT